MSTVKAWAALEPGSQLQPFTYEMAPLQAEEVEIENRTLWHLPYRSGIY